MPKPICVKCHRFFRPKKNGFFFIEGMPAGTERPCAGLEEAHLWKPYKLWVGDKWACQGCDAEIVVGFGATPVSEHYKEDFNDEVKRLGADQFQVNDC